MTKYISDYGHAEISLELPGIMNGTHAFLFAFPCDPAAVQKLVDMYLNAPAKGAVEYSMIGNQVFTAFLHVDQLTSNLELMGWTTDHECGIWVPLLARGGGIDRIVIWMPYIVIDWQQGMTTGREVLGYRKTMGEVVIPLNARDAASFVVKTNVFPTFSKTTQEVFETLLTVQRAGTLGERKSDWQNIKQALSALHDAWKQLTGSLKAHRWQLAIDAAALLVELKIPIVNLKQFRAAHDTTQACYQAIIECGIGIHGFHGGGFLAGDYTLNITSAASHRIAEDMGLKVPLQADFGIWMLLDLTADPGREVVRN